jgi:hypothetical protein
MSQTLQYSREPNGRSARSKLLFCLLGIGASVLATWFLWGSEAWDRRVELRNIQRARQHVFPPGTVVYSDDPGLRRQLKNKAGYRPADIGQAIVYDAKLPYYASHGAATVYVGGRNSPEGVERIIQISVGYVLGDGLQPPARQREMRITGSILETRDYGGRHVDLVPLGRPSPLVVNAAPGSSFTVWAGQADPNDPSSVTFDCAVDTRRFSVRFKLENPETLTVTPIGVESTKLVGTVIVNLASTRPAAGAR